MARLTLVEDRRQGNMDVAGIDKHEVALFLDEVEKDIVIEAPHDSWNQPRPDDVVVVEVGENSSATNFRIHCWHVGAGVPLTAGGVSLDRCVRTMRRGEEATFKAKDGESVPAARVRLTGLHRCEDLRGDGRLVRTTLRDGHRWQMPQEGSELRVRFSWQALPAAVAASVAGALELCARGQGVEQAQEETALEIRGAADQFAEVAGSPEVAALRLALLRRFGGTITVCVAGEGGLCASSALRVLRGASLVSASSAGVAAVEAAEEVRQEIEAAAVTALGTMQQRVAREVTISLEEERCVCSAEDWIPGLAGLRVLSDLRIGQRCSVRLAPDLAFGAQGLPDFGVPPDATLEYDVELLQIMKLEDISLDGSGRITKKTTHEGEGYDHPAEGAEVVLRVEARDDASGAVLVEDCELKFLAASGKFCSAVEETVLLMKKGESCEVRCTDSSECEDPELKLQPRAGAVVVFSLELLDFEKMDIYGMEEVDRAAYCSKRKEVGSKLFQEGATRRALRRYQHVSGSLAYLEDWKNAAVVEEATALRRVCHLNAAACWLKLEDWRQAETSCSTVLGEDPSNGKALFRRAKALEGLSEYREAEQSLRKLLECDKENKEAARMLIKMRQLVKSEMEKEKEMFSRMARGMRDAPDTAAGSAAAGVAESAKAGGKGAAMASKVDRPSAAQADSDGSDGSGVGRTMLIAAAAVLTLSAVSILARRWR